MSEEIKTLYHYCTTDALISIISSNSIRLSSLTLSNDSNEGKVIGDTFNRIFNKKGFDLEAHNHATAILDSFEETFDGLGFCLSSEGDLLSQWRGYTDDGKGFSIGFSKAYLSKLSESSNTKPDKLALLEVIYDPDQQELEVQPAYEVIKKVVKDDTFKFPTPPNLLNKAEGQDQDNLHMKKIVEHKAIFLKIFYEINNKLPNFFALKNSAFKEEKEWRLISFLTKKSINDCQIRAKGNRLIPYREFPLVDLSIPIIDEIVIGPCNDTPEFVIEKLLYQYGFRNVLIRRSDSTYR